MGDDFDSAKIAQRAEIEWREPPDQKRRHGKAETRRLIVREVFFEGYFRW
jgi:hypothetical protein